MTKRTVVNPEMLDADLTTVADAIRGKTGTTEYLDFPEGFVSAVQSITGGGESTPDYLAQFAMGTLTEYRSEEITTLRQYAFSRNPSLVNVELPNWEKEGGYAFQECKGLKRLVFPSLTVSPEACFFNCTGLEYVDLPVIAYWGSNTFKNCSSLATVIMRKAALTTLGSTNVFVGTLIESGTGYVYVPDSLVNSYKTAANWSTYANQIKPISELPSTV